MDWDIPQTSGELLKVTLGESDRLFIVGANGSGKSALIQHFASSIKEKPIRRISAHRQTWLSSGSINLTAAARQDLERSTLKSERRIDSRWMEHNAEQKLSAVLFDLVAKENARARSIAQHVDDRNTSKAAEVAGFTFQVQHLS